MPHIQRAPSVVTRAACECPAATWVRVRARRQWNWWAKKIREAAAGEENGGREKRETNYHRVHGRYSNTHAHACAHEEGQEKGAQEEGACLEAPGQESALGGGEAGQRRTLAMLKSPAFCISAKSSISTLIPRGKREMKF